MNEPIRPLLLAAAIALAPATANAQTRPLDTDQALAIAMAHPSLCEASHQTARAAARVRSEEAIRPLTLGADGGASHQRIPTLAVGGATTPTTDAVTLGADLDKTFAWGTRVGVRVETRYQRTTIPVAPGAQEQLELGPGYGLTARLSLEQPLLRGAGADLGEAELDARQSEHRAAENDAEGQRRAVLRDALVGYYELWFAQEALRIEQAASALANEELDAARARVASGTLAPSELTALLTQRAERREAVATAALGVQQRALELGWRLGSDEGTAYRATTAPPLPPVMGGPSVDGATRRALSSSPVLAALQAQREAATRRMRRAGEADRPRLDLAGWVQGDGLGHRDVAPAFEQLGTFGAVSAQIGLRFEAPVTGSRHDAERAAARADVAAITARLQARRQQIATDARLWVERASTARERLGLARETAEAAREELAATRERHRAGEAIALEIRRAIEAVRRAELRIQRLRVDWAIADTALRALTGEPVTGRRLPEPRCR